MHEQRVDLALLRISREHCTAVYLAVPLLPFVCHTADCGLAGGNDAQGANLWRPKMPRLQGASGPSRESRV